MKCAKVFASGIALAFVWAVATLPCMAQVYHLRPTSEPIPATLFGLHIHKATTTTQWPSIPFGVFRLWDVYGTWSDLEPQKGKWNFTTLDKLVALSEEHGVRMQLSLGTPPPWASARPAEPPAFRPGGTAEPKNMEDWRNYVRTLATRYKGRIHEWELWNEPNLKQFYTGNVTTMVELAREAYQILKEVDSSNILISPAPTGGYTGPSWVENFLNAGGGNYVDVIGFHFYVTLQGPEAMVPVINQVRTIKSAKGMAEKPLWNTETGWFIQNSTNDVKPTASFMVLSQEQAVAFVARSYILSWADGVTRLNWYDWDSTTMALSEDGGKKRKPAAYSYLMTEKWLVGARMTACDSDSSGTWVCQITRDGGYNGYIVWNTQGGKNFSVPGSWHVQVEQDLGSNSRSVRGANSVQIGIAPILLENMAH